jgi:Arm domain-containing DNA-binding protein
MERGHAVSEVYRCIRTSDSTRDDRVDYFDPSQPGFGLRVTSTGVKSWIYMYRVGRRLRRWALGRYPALSLADARKRAKIAGADLLKESPVDPAAGKVEARGALTIGELALDYLEQHAKLKKLTWKADQWMLEKDVLPVWKHVPAQDVTRQMISDGLGAEEPRSAESRSTRGDRDEHDRPTRVARAVQMGVSGTDASERRQADAEHAVQGP